MNAWTRSVLGSVITLVLITVTLAGVALVGVVVSGRSTHPPVPTAASGLAPAPVNGATAGHGRRLVVAVVAGNDGTIASDLLAPYDIFASSSAFTTYVVARNATPAPLESGPAVVPTHTFGEIDATAWLRPDLVVVPGLSEPTGTAEAPLRAWVARQHEQGARILGVCSGSMVLAATGMLDGLEATSHWSRISALEASRPEVHWLRGRRYVEDGSVTTTAAVTSGVPAALHLVAELAGPAEARRVADLHPELGWTPSDGTTIDKDGFAARDWPVGLNYVLPWFRPTVGIALRDGVDELDATAAFEVYGQSAAARAVGLSTTGRVRTRHGLVLLTTTFAAAPRLSRVVVPGAGMPGSVDSGLRSWAHDRHLALERLGGPGRGGFMGALQNLADDTDAGTANATAKMIGYPTTGLDLGHGHRAWRTVLLAIAVLALSIGVGIAPRWLVERRRRRNTVTRPSGPALSVGGANVSG